jgi:chromate reductase, NAD(P)H dehydrogenase (quinone)
MTTHSSMYVLGVSGSLRRASYNAALLRAAAELMPPGMTLEIFDLASAAVQSGCREAVS